MFNWNVINCCVIAICMMFSSCTRHERSATPEVAPESVSSEAVQETDVSNAERLSSSGDSKLSVIDQMETRVNRHPHLLLNGARLSEIRTRMEEDPLMAKMQEYLYMTAVSYLSASPVEYRTTPPAMLGQSRAALGRILALGMQYHLTGEERFAARAREELLAVCAFPDWLPKQFLGIAEMSLAVSIGYDWFYDYLSEEDREILRRALVEHALSFAPSAYGISQEGKKSRWSPLGDGGTATNNWNQVCNGGLLAAALILREEAPELSQIVVEGVVKTLPRAMVHYAPDGAWPEGPTYWAYATNYNVVAIALLEDVFGTDYGLAKQPGFDRAASFYMQAFGATGTAFNYGDAGLGKSYQVGCQPAFAWLANRFGPESAISVARERMRGFLEDPLSDYAASKIKGTASRFGPLHLLWFPSVADDEATEDLDLDAHFSGTSDIAFFRSEWGDENALWLGFKAGTNGFAHGQLDLGNFILEVEGVRWSQDLGADSYRLPGYWQSGNGGQRWSYFRNNNLSHNCIGPEGQLQDATATAPITEFASFKSGGFAICDMTNVFPGVANRIMRGVAMLNRNRVLVQDEWSGYDRKLPLDWRMMTGAEIELVDGGRGALLSLDGKQLRVQILEPSLATFSTISAKPETDKEYQNQGSQILRILYEPIRSEARIAVLFSPIGEAWPELAPPKLAALSEWSKFADRKE